MNYYTTISEPSSISICLDLIARYGPKFMRVGGIGGVSRECRHVQGKRQSFMTEAQRQAIIESYNRHNSLDDVAAECGWSRAHTWRVLNAAHAVKPKKKAS
jgi:hypothetical protein